MTRKHIVIGDMVNSSVVATDEGVLVIDTSVNDQTAQKLHDEAVRQGEVLYVINTHEHGDHLAGNHLFSSPIISSAAAREQMAIGAGALPTLAFSQQLDLYLGEPVVLKHFGGHCPGEAVVYFPERKLLFTGDLVFAGRMPYMGEADFNQWLGALSQLESWEVKTVVPGHGPQGGIELLTRQRQWLEDFIAQVRNWKQEGVQPAGMLERVLERHEVPERWHPMVNKAIELVLGQYH